MYKIHWSFSVELLKLEIFGALDIWNYLKWLEFLVDSQGFWAFFFPSWTVLDGPAEVSPIPSPRPSGYMSVRDLDAEDWRDWGVDIIYIYIIYII